MEIAKPSMADKTIDNLPRLIIAVILRPNIPNQKSSKFVNLEQTLPIVVSQISEQVFQQSAQS